MRIKIPVVSILLRFINSGDKKGNNYDIAKAMLENYNNIPKLTIHELADACFVSSASISRFIRMIGFESYSSFKGACKDSFGIDIDYSKDISKATDTDIKSIFNKYTESVVENIKYTFENLDINQLDRICDKIFNSKEVVLFGLEFATLLGQHFQIKMASMNKLVKIGITYDDQMEIAESLNDGAVVIIASLEGGYFYICNEVLNVLNKKNITLVALTMKNNTKLLRYVDEVLICNQDNSSTQGRITLLYMIEMILMHYCIKHQINK